MASKRGCEETSAPVPPPAAPVPTESTPLLSQLKKEEPKDHGPSWYDVAVCSLAYALATLFVISPLRSVLGSTGSKHTVATTAVWFHPVRTQGNLIEVLYYTLRLLVLAITISLGATACVRFSHFVNMPTIFTTVMLMLWLCGALGTIGFLKVRASNQSFNTASSAAIIFLVMVLLREDDAQYGVLPFDRLFNYLEMVAIGASISSATSVLFYRKSSLDNMVRDSQKLSELYAEMLELLVASFGTRLDPRFTEANQEANVLLSQIQQQQKYARYEIAFKSKLVWRNLLNFADQREAFRKGTAHFSCLQRQSMHIGGMLHCESVVRMLSGDTNEKFLRDLREPMSKFAAELSAFVHDREHKRENELVMNDRLIQYTHARDAILSEAVTGGTTPTPADSTAASSIAKNSAAAGSTTATANKTDEGSNSFQAASTLFTHFLQDLGIEIISGYARDTSIDPALEAALPSSQEHDLGVASTSKVNEQFLQLNKVLFPTRKATHGGIGPKIWKLLRRLRNLDVRHGLRVALGAAVISLPAFIPEYRPEFQRWHGEWAVITYMIIMARNFGAMTKNIPLRLTGTTIGAVLGIAANKICGENPYLLFICGFLMGYMCYRRILSNVNPVFGRFILLTYNLVCLYNFSLVVDDPDDSYDDRLDPIYDIAFHRMFSVITGVLWAVFITLTVWPYSARKALRSNLCIQWMRMGMLWKSDPLGVIPYSGQTFRPAHNRNLYRFRGISSERELQAMMLELDVFLKASPNEFRLRGKFDPGPYKQLLDSTQTILDAFHSISILIEDEPCATAREHDLAVWTTAERRELCQLLFLQFYTASSSVRLGFPVPEYLPSPEQAVNRLVEKVSERRLEVGAPKPHGSLSQNNYDFVLFYSYVTVVLTVSQEMKRIHAALRELFGALDDDTLFAYV